MDIAPNSSHCPAGLLITEIAFLMPRIASMTKKPKTLPENVPFWGFSKIRKWHIFPEMCHFRDFQTGILYFTSSECIASGTEVDITSSECIKSGTEVDITSSI